MLNCDIVHVITLHMVHDLCNDIYILWLCSCMLVWLCFIIHLYHTCAMRAPAHVEASACATRYEYRYKALSKVVNHIYAE